MSVFIYFWVQIGPSNFPEHENHLGKPVKRVDSWLQPPEGADPGSWGAFSNKLLLNLREATLHNVHIKNISNSPDQFVIFLPYFSQTSSHLCTPPEALLQEPSNSHATGTPSAPSFFPSQNRNKTQSRILIMTSLLPQLLGTFATESCLEKQWRAKCDILAQWKICGLLE